jgi:hypothetical protein
MHTNKTITCKNCGWSWSKEDSNVSDMYLCHKCGFDNSNDYKMEAGGLLAPNGKPSNLTPEQYALVRTPEFKAWFGFWENDPENASKVVDENVEPLVVYHGAPKGDFNTFTFNLSKNTSNHPSSGLGFFFTQYKDLAEQYSQRKFNKYQEGKNKEAKVYNCYLSIKNPLIIGYSEYYKLTEKHEFDAQKIKIQLIDKNYDGIIVGEEEIIAFYPNQIKLADGSNTTFDAGNPDIRFSGGGRITASRLMIPSVRGGWTKEKILRYLKSNPSDTTSTYSLAKFISDLDSWQELKDRLYYHGTTNYIEKGLNPSIVFSDRFAESNGGGGYGDKYWGISLTKRKRTAESFSGMSSGVTIYPVFLKKDAKVIEREDLQDSSEIEDIIVELYEQGVDAVWIGGGEEELVVVNPQCILLYKKGSQYFSAHGGFKSQQLTDEQIKEIYEQSKLDWENYYKKFSESNKEGRQEFLNSLEPIKFSAGGAVSATLEDVIALLNKYQFRDTKTPIKGGYLSFANRTKVNGNDVSCFIDTKEKAIVLDSQYGLKEMGYDLKLMEAYFKKNRLKKDTYKEGGKIEYGENEELHNQILAAAQIDKDAIAKATSLIFVDAGYHRGELKIKSDYFERGYWGDNIGTGFYFISDPKEVVRGGSAKSNPKEFRVVDFSKYNLFVASDANTYWGTKFALKKAFRDLWTNDASAKEVVDAILKNHNVDRGLQSKIRNYNGGEAARDLLYRMHKVEEMQEKVKSNREFEELNKYYDELRNEYYALEKIGFDTVVAEMLEAYMQEHESEDWYQSERFETLMLKALGYEGIDARKIKEGFGMSSPDSFSEGSVIFDLKDGTVKTLTQAYIEAKKKNNNPELVAIVDEALEKVSTQITYRNGGLTDAIKHCFQNLMTNGIVITNPNQSIAVVMYNTGGQKRDRSLYHTPLLSRCLGIKNSDVLIDKFDKGWYDNFSEKEIDELHKYNRIIIMNQNEICFDSSEKE